MFNFKAAFTQALRTDSIHFSIRNAVYSIPSEFFLKFLASEVQQLMKTSPEIHVFSTLSDAQKQTILQANFSANSFNLSAWHKVLKNSQIERLVTPNFILYLKSEATHQEPKIVLDFMLLS